MLEVAARLILGGLLAGASVAKLASPGSSRAALATFGVADRNAQSLVWAVLIFAELVLAAGVVAGSDAAALGAAAVMLMFAATMVGALLRGRAGAPCACFGARSRISWSSVARNVGLAAAFAALPWLPEGDLSTDEWLALGLALALLACTGLGLAVLALAREVGLLRLRLGPQTALEIAEEGPELGSRVSLPGRFAPAPDSELALAVFTSPGCRICEALKPAIGSLSSDPLLALATFDECADADVWSELRIPGSPFAIAVDLAGTVLAKGAFNNLAQLESVLATADRRRAERRTIESLGV